jgi:hypothetical protein
MGSLLQEEGEEGEVFRDQLSHPECSKWIFEFADTASVPTSDLRYAVAAIRSLFSSDDRSARFSTVFDDDGRTAMTHLLEVSTSPESDVLQRFDAIAFVCPELLQLPDKRGRLPVDLIRKLYHTQLVDFAAVMLKHDPNRGKMLSFVSEDDVPVLFNPEDNPFHIVPEEVDWETWRAHWLQRVASFQKWEQAILVANFMLPRREVKVLSLPLYRLS